jgi:hypothetical protein
MGCPRSPLLRDRIVRRISLCALGLACGIALGGASTPQQPAAIPNFGGLWAIRGGSFDFAPPPPGMGAGPLVNTSGNRLVPVANYDSPLLKPWAAEIVRKHGELLLAGRIAPDAHTTCRPEGVPYILQLRGTVQFLQTPDWVMMIYMNGNHRRLIHLNTQHSNNPKPSWAGESVGHYEGGDTLVIDTIAIAVRDVSSIDRFGTPHTEAIHVVERYRITEDRKSLQTVFTVEDPGTFNMPWHASAAYLVSDEGFEEDICAENIRNIGTFGVIVTPEDNTPDF